MVFLICKGSNIQDSSKGDIYLKLFKGVRLITWDISLLNKIHAEKTYSNTIKKF